MPGIKEVLQHIKKQDIVNYHVEIQGRGNDGTPGHIGLAFMYEDGSRDMIVIVGKTNKPSEDKSLKESR
jgi:hypothetical protein